MPRASFAYRITADQVGLGRDPAYVGAPAAVRAAVLRRLVLLGLREKDADLAHGLDKDGSPLVPVSAATRKHRRSAMGPADPDAPALMPAWALSRTRSLLDGRAIDRDGGYAEFFWRYDQLTGGSWGKILDHHRRGIGRRRVVRDVIGASAGLLARVRAALLAWWAAFKARGFREAATTPPAAAPAPRVAAIGRTDFHNFTYGIGSDGRGGGAEASTRALAAGRSTGMFQRRTPGFGGFRGMPGEVPPRPTPPPTPAPKPKPKPRPKPAPPRGPTIDVRAGVSPEAEASARAVVAAYPERVRRDLEARGVRVVVGRDLPSVDPTLAAGTPRGWPEGMTWANSEGVHLPGRRWVVATEYSRAYPSRVEYRSTRFEGVLRHETGHAHDDAGDRSTSPEFRAAHAADVAAIPEGMSPVAEYYLQAGYAGPREAYAELFGQLLGGGCDWSDLVALFPRSAEVVRGLLR